MTHWLAEIVESARIIEGQPLDLTEALERLTNEGWTVRLILPNGVNRWTIICERKG